MFLIKSILLVIVNKKPHFKQVPLLIFQFPSPPTLNNLLSHLLNLYSFVTYLYFSSILFFFFSLLQGHMKQKNGSRCPFRPESAVSTCFGGHFNRIDSRFCWNRREFGRVGANKKKKKKKVESQRVGRWTPRRATLDFDVATLEPHWCFLVLGSNWHFAEVCVYM